MSENGVSRGSSYEAINARGQGSQQASPSGLELHRRLFSCCNVALQQVACLVHGHERIMLMEQPTFTEHAMMKAIMGRVSDQRYSEVQEFVDDFTKLVEKCVVERDRRAVLDALINHVSKTGQPDTKRPSKAAFHGFPHPLLEEMLAQVAMARKKISPSGAHVTVDIGRYLARAYGLGLTSGARLIGQPSKERAFHAQRKAREVELANAVAAEEATAASKAQKRSKPKEKGVEGPKKKQKLPSPASITVSTPKPNRSLRATRRMISEDSADELPRSETPVAARKVIDTAALASDLSGGKPQRKVIHQRIKIRDRVHCHHQQGKVVEMYDEDYPGLKKQAIIKGSNVTCLCGCGETMKGSHWLVHNGGRSSNRHPGYPWKYMRIVETKERLSDHWPECDTHEHLCDSCRLWEAPGLPMSACWVCRTSIHAVEGCAVRKSSDGADESLGATAAEDFVSPPSAKARSRPARRKEARAQIAESTPGVANGGDIADADDLVNQGKRDDPNAGAWICQICAGQRTEGQRATFNRRKSG